MGQDRPDLPPQTDQQHRHAGADPLGRAMLAHYHNEPGQLAYRDGGSRQDGNVANFYFSSPESWGSETIECLERLTDHDPILDVGCGAGTHLRWWADRDIATVGVDVSPNAIRTARERGLENVLVGDMFDLPVQTDAFGAVHAVGTQLGLGGSLAGIRELLTEFARVTVEGGVAVVDNYDPTQLDEDFFGYRSDPREGIARRCFHLEFECETADGERYREVGRTLQFLLCSPVRLRETASEAPWRVDEVLQTDGEAHYRAVLRKR